jgi:hypothetical protein
MKSLQLPIKALLTFMVAATSFILSAEEKIVISSQYDILTQVEIRAGPGTEHEKKVNQKASDMLKEIVYLSVDSSTTVKVTQIKGDWVEIQVVEPDYLAASHRGWIPLKAIKMGDSTRKKSGWIRHTCLVYLSKNTKSEPIGYLAQPASVGVSDDGSGWLTLIHGPVRDSKTKKFLNQSDAKKVLFIEAKFFTELMPSKW